jgi:hypothetical protein
MRFIIEAALLQAELLDRTLVIPSFVYARACEYNMYVCDVFPTLNRCSYTLNLLSSPALFARTLQLWSIRVTL